MKTTKPLTIDSFVEIAPGLVKKVKKAYPANYKNIRLELVDGNPVGPVMVVTDYDPQYVHYKAFIGGIPIGKLNYSYEPLDGTFLSLDFHSKKVDYRRLSF